MSTGFVWHEQYMWHDTGSYAGVVPAGGLVQPDQTYEHPETKRRLRNLLEASGLLDHLTAIKPRPATEAELQRLHTPGYVAKIQAMSADRGGEAGEFTPFGTGSYEIAALAAGGVMAAADAIIAGHVENAYALVRPPGHHAEADNGRGFCIFGNIALAALHILEVHGLSRIAVVDWDVHHGNGTQAAFYEDPRVLTISIHQDRNYPLDSGFMTERGSGAGLGYNLNVPLPPGSGHGAYLATFERVVVPALRAFEPEFVFVASGFDSSAADPLGRMLAYSETYREMTRLLMAQAAETAAGRLLLVHEGGYSTSYVPGCGLAAIEALSGHRTEYQDVAGMIVPLMGGFELQPHQASVIDDAAKLAGEVKRPG